MGTLDVIDRVRLEDLENIAAGAGFLGVGGGGDPYIGYLIAKAAIEEFGEPQLVSPNDFGDDDLVIGCAFIGAPSVMQEKCIAGEDAVVAIRMVEEKLGRKVGGIVVAEIGGLNGMLPIATAARMGLPLVDADSVGRAVPFIDMTAWNSEGLKTGPVAMVSEHLDTVVIDVDSPHRSEEVVRHVASAMGLSVMSALYSMPGRDMKRASITHTVSIARGIGQAIRESDRNPVASLLNYLRQTEHYSKCGLLASGKVVHLEREVKNAFVVGNVKVQCESGEIAEINFQNEYLKLEKDGKLLATAPDLISIIDTETGAAIAAEALRFGQRVTVIGTSSPNLLRTEQALENCGPKRFGIGEYFQSIESINRW